MYYALQSHLESLPLSPLLLFVMLLMRHHFILSVSTTSIAPNTDFEWVI